MTTPAETNPIDRPIFIGGCERSGTTLLGAMLGAHSDCICTPESQFKIDLFRRFGCQLKNREPASALSAVAQHWRFEIWELDIDLAGRAPSFQSSSDLLFWLVGQYAEQVGKPRASIWIDHTPQNIRHALLLHGLFPASKLIHIVRDGRAVANSIKPLDWGPNTVIRAAPWWVARVAYGLAVECMWPEEKIKRVRYEDLVQRPAPTLRELCAFLELDYEPAMVQASGFTRPAYTSSQHALIGDQPDSSRTTAWKQKLTAREIEVFEHLTHDFLRYFHYPLEYESRTRPPARGERFQAAIYELVKGKIVNGIRHRIRKYLAIKHGSFLGRERASQRG